MDNTGANILAVECEFGAWVAVVVGIRLAGNENGGSGFVGVVNFASRNPRSRYLSGLHERPVAVRNQVSVLGTEKSLPNDSHSSEVRMADHFKVD